MSGESICDFLFSADLLVPHPRDAVAQMIETIGLPAPGPGAYVDYPLSGWDCVFALVNKAWPVGPTRLEVIGPKVYPETPPDNQGAYIASVQGGNPCKTHATVIATPDLASLTDHVRSLGVRHWLQPGSPDETGFDRLWMGISADDHLYEPDADAGMFVEVIPSDSPAFVPKLFQVPPPEPENPTPGQLLRIVSRSYLVRDLDRSLETLTTNLLWEHTDAGIIDDPDAGGRHAVMSRNYEQGATLKLVQPRSGTPAGEHLERYGDGPYTIRIAVHDLEAKREDLRSRGTAFADLPATEHEPARVAVDPAATAAMPFELIEFGSASA